MKDYVAAQHDILIGLPVSYRINGQNLRAFGLEAVSYPTDLLMPSVRQRRDTVGARSGSRNFGGSYDNWSFSLTFHMYGADNPDIMEKKDKLCRWLDIEQYRQQEFIVDKHVVKGMMFEVAGHGYYYDKGSVAVTNGNATVRGYLDYIADSGTADSDIAYRLVDAGQNFLTTVESGYIAVNTDDNVAAVVLSVLDDDNLILDTDAFPDGDEAYEIHPPAYWFSFLSPDSKILINSVEYRVKSIDYDGKMTLTANYTGSSGIGVTYQAERKRYLIVDYDGSSINAIPADRAQLKSDRYELTLNFITSYPYWIGDLVEIDYEAPDANTFLKARGIGTAISNPTYKVIGSAVNPELTASEMTFLAHYNGGYGALDVVGDDIDPSVQLNAIKHVTAQVGEGITLHDKDVVYFHTMNDHSTPVQYNANLFSAHTGMVSLFFKPSWGWDTVHTGKRYIWYNSANYCLYFENNNFWFQAGTGDTEATNLMKLTEPNFNAGDMLLITVGWDANATTEMRGRISNLTGTPAQQAESTNTNDDSPAYPGEHFIIGSDDETDGGKSCEGIIDELAITRQMDSDFTASDCLHNEMYNGGTGAVPTEYKYPLLVYASFDHQNTQYNVATRDSTGQIQVSGTSGAMENSNDGETLIPIVTHNNPTVRVTAISQGATEATLTIADGEQIFTGDDRVVVWDGTGYKKKGFVDGTPAEDSGEVKVDNGAGAIVADLDKVGVSLDFDAQYYAQATVNTVHDITTQDIGISAWVQANSGAGTSTIVGKYSGTVGYIFRLTGGIARLVIYDAESDTYSTVGTTDLRDGKFHHVVGILDRDNDANCKIYVDGYDDTTSTSGAAALLAADESLTNSGKLEIGSRQNGAQKFDGKIRDVIISYPADIMSNAGIGEMGAAGEILTLATNPLTPGSVEHEGYYACTEGTGTTLTDGKAVGNLTLHDANAWTQECYISKNLIADGDCENGGIGAFAQVNAVAALDTFEKTTSNVKKDVQALHFTVDAAGGAGDGISQTVAATSGDDFVLRGWTKIATGDTIDLDITNGGGNVLDLTNTDLEFFETCFEVTGNPVIQFLGTAASDDCTVDALDMRENLVDNGSIEVTGAEILTDTSFAVAGIPDWDVTGEVVKDDPNNEIDFTFAAGSLNGTLQQVHGDRVSTGTNDALYRFTYTIAVTTQPDGNFTLKIDDTFSDEEIALNMAAGTHTVYFWSAADATTQPFTIIAAETNSTEGIFTIDDVTLKEIPSWSKVGSPTVSEVNASELADHSGSVGIRLALADDEEGVQQTVTVVNGQAYEFATWAKNDNQDTEILLTGATTKTIDTTTSGNVWTRFSHIFKATTTSLVIKLVSGAANQACWYDDVSVTEWYDAEMLAIPQASRFKPTVHDKGVLITSGDELEYTNVYGNSDEFSFIARINPQFDGEDGGCHYIFDYVFTTDAHRFSLMYGIDTTRSKGTAKRWTFMADTTEITSTADQVFTADSRLEISGWYKKEGRDIEGTTTYAQLWVNGTLNKSYTSSISITAGTPQKLAVGHKYGYKSAAAQGYRAEAIIDELGLYCYALTDDDLISAYTENRELSSYNVNLSYTGTLDTDDILTIESASHESEIYDDSAGTKASAGSLLSGRSPGMRGTEEEEQTLYLTNAVAGKFIIVRRAKWR